MQLGHITRQFEKDEAPIAYVTIPLGYNMSGKERWALIHKIVVRMEEFGVPDTLALDTNITKCAIDVHNVLPIPEEVWNTLTEEQQLCVTQDVNQYVALGSLANKTLKKESEGLLKLVVTKYNREHPDAGATFYESLRDENTEKPRFTISYPAYPRGATRDMMEKLVQDVNAFAERDVAYMGPGNPKDKSHEVHIDFHDMRAVLGNPYIFEALLNKHGEITPPKKESPAPSFASQPRNQPRDRAVSEQQREKQREAKFLNEILVKHTEVPAGPAPLLTEEELARDPQGFVSKLQAVTAQTNSKGR